MVFSGRSFPKRSGTDMQLYTYGAGNNQKFSFTLAWGNAPSYSSIQVGAVRPPNCGGFALRITGAAGDVQFSGVSSTSWNSVEDIASKTIAYFNNNTTGRTIRRVSGVNLTPTYSINSNEYRVALRVRTKNTGNSKYDYHYYIQTNDGMWAHKAGGTASQQLGFVNPSTSTWANGYNSAVIYFAVSR